ncbi:MAG: glycosyltransferase family 39 protein [Bacteroidetes bacterium]|nr:glycosyltransferase family 39 protein [Bacteroidota bacterium]
MQQAQSTISLQQRLAVAAIALLFVICKWQHLSYPFYWDECWPYAAAIKQMYHHGASLLPNAIPSEISRGHPMFFFFIETLWMKIFGASHMAMHSLPLLISVTLLVIVYQTCKQLFGNTAALYALLIIAAQQTFFVQSSFVFLEILLALLSFVSIWFYMQQRYLLTAVCLAMLFLTKESGIITGVVLGIDAFIKLFSSNIIWRQKVRGLIAVTFPFAVIAAYFILQKKMNGWYVFPYHANAMETTWVGYYLKVRATMQVYFVDDYRNYFFTLLTVLSLAAAVIKRNVRYAVILLPVITTILIVTESIQNTFATYLLFAAWLLSVLYTITSFIQLAAYTGNQKRFLLLQTFFILAFTIYTPLFFLIQRYLTISLVPLLYIAAVMLHHLAVQLRYKTVLVAVPLIAAGISIAAYFHQTDLSDNKMGAYDGMYVEQSAVTYLEQQGYYDKKIAIFENLPWLHLSDTNTGFRSNNRPFTQMRWGIYDSTEVVLLENIESNRSADTSLKCRQDTSFVLAHRAARGLAWSEVFVRKNIKH